MNVEPDISPGYDIPVAVLVNLIPEGEVPIVFVATEP